MKDQKFVFTCIQKLCCRNEDGGKDEEEWKEKWEQDNVKGVELKEEGVEEVEEF